MFYLRVPDILFFSYSNKSRRGQQELAGTDNALREVRGVSLATQHVDGFVPKKLD